MTIYFHEYKDYVNTVQITEIEVKETEKCYMGNHTRISKTEIDIVQPRWRFPMYSLSVNKKEYLHKVLQKASNDILDAEKRLSEIKTKYDKIKELYNSTEETNA